MRVVKVVVTEVAGFVGVAELAEFEASRAGEQGQALASAAPSGACLVPAEIRFVCLAPASASA